MSAVEQIQRPSIWPNVAAGSAQALMILLLVALMPASTDHSPDPRPWWAVALALRCLYIGAAVYTRTVNTSISKVANLLPIVLLLILIVHIVYDCTTGQVKFLNTLKLYIASSAIVLGSGLLLYMMDRRWIRLETLHRRAVRRRMGVERRARSLMEEEAYIESVAKLGVDVSDILAFQLPDGVFVLGFPEASNKLIGNTTAQDKSVDQTI